MPTTSPLVNKNIIRQETHKYAHTSMVSHGGTPVSFAMRDDGSFFYSVLDLSKTDESNAAGDHVNDKDFWSKVKLEGTESSRLQFPLEISQVGYSVIPNYPIAKYDSKNVKIIYSDPEAEPLDINGVKLSAKEIQNKTDFYYSSTARLGAIEPFQVISDGKYIYLFRQSIAANHENNTIVPIVNNTLLVDRFILSGTILKMSREIRYQRSRHKTEPESKKDTLSAVDIEGNPFYEPTRELAFANNLSNGNFSVLLIPGADSEEQRWQIFTVDSVLNKINSFNIKFDYSILFDTMDSQTLIDEFVNKYQLDSGFVSNISKKLGAKQDITSDFIPDLLKLKAFSKVETGVDRESLEDELKEVIYAIQTGVTKDDFRLLSQSEWPLLPSKDDSKLIEELKAAKKETYTFCGPKNELKPGTSVYYAVNGISSCYYFQQEIGTDGKPMKNKACVMLALGLEDKRREKFIGILNFAVAASGRLSRLTTDSLNMPDINVKALDQNKYLDTEALKNKKWQEPQQMTLLDIDTNGLGTSGGVLKFAYTSADISAGNGYSDAVVATNPYLFDDSLGKVNLYFMGENKNFFVLYFNPTGSKGITITGPENPFEPPPLILNMRLDRDVTLKAKATVPDNVNTCLLTIESKDLRVEEWRFLPKRCVQIAGIMNGNGELNLGTLETLGKKDDPRAGYLKTDSGHNLLNLRTTVENTLLFTNQEGYGEKIGGGNTFSVPLKNLSEFLLNNPTINIANKQFLIGDSVSLKADFFYKSYLSDILPDSDDIEKLWSYLMKQGILTSTSEKPYQGILGSVLMTGNQPEFITLLEEKALASLMLNLLKDGSSGDKNLKLGELQRSLIALLADVAKARILTFAITDVNDQKVDRLEAGLLLSAVYNYADNFKCSPSNLQGASAAKWDHAKSYLFNVAVNYKDKIDDKSLITSSFNYTYNIKNTVGQWEDWEASLALQLKPSNTEGVALYTEDVSKLNTLLPTAKGLSVEAWIKPSAELDSNGTIVYFANAGQNYSLSIQASADKKTYNCIAVLGKKKLTGKGKYAFKDLSGNEPWRHLAFTHQKYWGYQVINNVIKCGNDSSLQLTNDFTLEVLVQINTQGTLLKKEEEYALSINKDNEVEFFWGENNVLFEWEKMTGGQTPPTPINEKIYQKINSQWHKKSKPQPLDGLEKFYKITLIRSAAKPQSEPSKIDYPITGNGKETTNSGSKWYDGKTSDELIKGMAEKQDQMENSMSLSQLSILGAAPASLGDLKTTYYYTLIVTNEDNTSTEWMSTTPVTVSPLEAYKEFVMGGPGFNGIFTSVRIWNRGLSKNEARALPVPENKTGLTSQWRMAEGKSVYLYDNVGENHGKATDGNWVDSPQTNRIGQFQLYVDGSPEMHETTTIINESKTPQFSIGSIKKDKNFTSPFKGFLEEIRIWNTARTNEQITDNAFGRLKGEWDQLLANYTFDDLRSPSDNKVRDVGMNNIVLTVSNSALIQDVLSTAPIATEIPQVRSALTAVITEYNDCIISRPAVAEYGDIQRNEDGSFDGVLKRCYSFIDAQGVWNRMTGYKIGNLVSQWFGQAQFAPQVMGYMEGSPPVPAENFPINKDGDVDTYAFLVNNSMRFRQAEEVAYNYNTSKEAGWKVAVDSEGDTGLELETLLAPLGFGISFKGAATLGATSNWETSGKRSESFERGTSVNTEYGFSAALTGYDNLLEKDYRYYTFGNTGFALVKSKTADIYLLRLAHNNALVSISWQPNPDIPEDVNILSFPINPLYTKQGCLDGKFSQQADVHYPQAQGAYGQYSYYKPREAYQLKKQIEREKMELKAYFEDSYDVAKTNSHFQAAATATGIAQLFAFVPAAGPAVTSAFNQVAGQLATQLAYNNTLLKNDIAKMGSQRNLVDTYVWTVEGGFYSEATEVAETQQETYANETSLSLGGGLGAFYDVKGVLGVEQKTLLSSGSSFTLTKSKTKESKTSFGFDVNVSIPTSPRYKYGGTDSRMLTKGSIKPGIVDAYRFMSFYLEPKGTNFTDLFTSVIDPIWLEQSADPNAQALRQARGNIEKAKPCWRIMHRVTYVSRVLPEFQPEAPPSLEKSMRISGIESNYMLIKKFEPYLSNISDPVSFSKKIDEIITNQLPEFSRYQKQIASYLMLYFNINQ